MTAFRPTTADIDASRMVIRDVAELSDSLSIEDALDYRRELVKVFEDARNTIALLDTHLIRTLEAPVTRGGLRYEVVQHKEKERFDHDRIAAGVQKRAHYDMTTGERIPDEEAVRNAVHLMRRLYLSPATRAKVTELDALGFVRKDIVTFERGAKEVRVSPAPEERPDDSPDGGHV